jgi:hypothetical protein
MKKHGNYYFPKLSLSKQWNVEQPQKKYDFVCFQVHHTFIKNIMEKINK